MPARVHAGADKPSSEAIVDYQVLFGRRRHHTGVGNLSSFLNGPIIKDLVFNSRRDGVLRVRDSGLTRALGRFLAAFTMRNVAGPAHTGNRLVTSIAFNWRS